MRRLEGEVVPNLVGFSDRNSEFRYDSVTIPMADAGTLVPDRNLKTSMHGFRATGIPIQFRYPLCRDEKEARVRITRTHTTYNMTYVRAAEAAAAAAAAAAATTRNLHTSSSINHHRRCP